MGDEKMNVTPEEISNMDAEELQTLQDQVDEEEDTGYGSPTPEKKDNQLKLFRDIINTEDSRKVANLHKTELGEVKVGVRGHLDISLYCAAEKLEPLVEYFEAKAEITSATSLSRKGFLLQTMITQIQKTQKIREPTPEVKRSIFGRKPDGGTTQ